MGNFKHLIIGAGPAGLSAVQAIREVDKTAKITLVSKEEVPPYSPAMLPYVLSGELLDADLFVKGREMLDRMNVSLSLHKEVAGIDSAAHQVTYSNGESESFDKLLIAMGARPLTLPIAYSANNIHHFRTYQDCERLQQTIGKTKQNIAICGGGLVAVEVAEKLCRAGHAVTLIELKSCLLPQLFSAKGIATIEDAFRNHGVTVLTNSTLIAVAEAGHKLDLTLSTGDTLRVDHLLFAIGVTPNLVKGLSAPMTGGGLIVGRHMETALPDIYAAGDVAAAFSFLDGHNAPCPILPEAVAQGKVAGTNMAGGNLEYKGWIRCNYLRCFESNLFSMGITDISAEPECSALEYTDDHGFLRILLKNERIIGAEGLNMTAIHPGVLLSLIRQQTSVAKQRDLLFTKPREVASWLMQKQRSAQTV
jgi:phenylglyoxylate dehydrogenase epsilon subunit